MVRLFLGFILSSLSDTLQVPFQNPLYSTRVDNQADCKGIPLRISPLLRIGNVYGQMSLFFYLGNENTNHLTSSFPLMHCTNSNCGSLLLLLQNLYEEQNAEPK